jgi:hypothetical protein
MAPRTKKKAAEPTQPTETIADYRFDAKRTNIPPAGLAAQGKLESPARIRYEYDPIGRRCCASMAPGRRTSYRTCWPRYDSGR